MDSIIGTEIDGYRIEEVLGQGGMGVVYRAEDIALSREVALKCINRSLTNDESFLRRFRSEARALAQIDSPYIVQVYTLSRLDIGLVIVMEFVEGGDLKQKIEGGGADWRETVPLMQQMLTALEHAHAADVVHRDIKPHNILLADTVTTHGNQVKMTDFGLAKINTTGDRSRTVTEGVYGSLTYMSPEQVEGLGSVDHRSDIYSLGMSAYEMLAGRLPFPEDGTTYKVMRTIVEEELPPLNRFVEDVPQRLIDIIMKTLEKDPDDRFQSATQMKTAVDEVARQWTDQLAQPTESARASTPQSSSSASRTVSDIPRNAPSSSRPPEDGKMERLGKQEPTPNGGFPGSTVITAGGLIILIVGIVVAGYVAYRDRGSTGHFLSSKKTMASSTSVHPLPSIIEPLVNVTRVAELEAEISRRVERGDLIRGAGPADFFISPQKCYVFVVNDSSGEVDAVLDTGTVRINLRTETEVPDWKHRYENQRQIWVAVSR